MLTILIEIAARQKKNWTAHDDDCVRWSFVVVFAIGSIIAERSSSYSIALVYFVVFGAFVLFLLLLAPSRFAVRRASSSHV